MLTATIELLEKLEGQAVAHVTIKSDTAQEQYILEDHNKSLRLNQCSNGLPKAAVPNGFIKFGVLENERIEDAKAKVIRLYENYNKRAVNAQSNPC